MESITHAPGQNASTRKPARTARSSSEPVSDQIRGFYYDARRAALGHDYLRRKWLPREGPLFFAFIQVMRSFCYYNPQTGELREQCYPKVETIAERCGVNPATIHRLIQRDPHTGEFLSKHAAALKRFIKVQPRWLYNPQVGHKTQRSNIYLVALDDPPVPEDDHLVEAKAGELAAILTMEQVRQQRQAEFASAPEEGSTDLQNASQYALAKCESVMSRKMPDKTLPVTLTSTPYLERTLDGRSSAGCSRGKQKPEEDEKKALVGGEPAASADEQPYGNVSGTSQPQRTLHSNTREKHQHQTQALVQAYPQMGATIHQALLDLGGSNPDGGVKTILEALTEVEAPPERMHDLFALGLKRLEQQRELITIPNPTGYLIGIMRHVAVEAMVKGWKVTQMHAEDEEKHAQALRSRGYRESGTQAPAEAVAEASAEAPGEESMVAPDTASATTEAAVDASQATPLSEPRDAEEQEPDDPTEAAQGEAREEAQRYASLPIDPQARQIWQSALERIQPRVSSSAFTTWFSGTSGLVLEEETLIVRVGSSFSRQHLEQRFSDLIASAVSEQRGIKTETRFMVIPEAQEEEA